MQLLSWTATQYFIKLKLASSNCLFLWDRGKIQKNWIRLIKIECVQASAELYWDDVWHTNSSCSRQFACGDISPLTHWLNELLRGFSDAVQFLKHRKQHGHCRPFSMRSTAQILTLLHVTFTSGARGAALLSSSTAAKNGAARINVTASVTPDGGFFGFFSMRCDVRCACR